MLLFNHGFYDVLGNPESVVHSDGQAVYYGYDTVGNRTGVRTEVHGTVQTYVTYEHDQLNRVTDVHDHDASQVPVDPDTWLTDAGAATTQLGYNPLGQLTTITRPNDVTTTYSYGDPASVITQGIDFEGQIYSHNQNPYQVYIIEHQDTESTPVTLSQYDYTYDEIGNTETMAVTAYGGTATNITYDYDRAYRLIDESYQLLGGATSGNEYQYDRAGNRTRMINDDGTTAYHYNNNDELTRVDLPDYTFEAYEYDARGNLTSVQLNQAGVMPMPIGSPTLYTYNARDQLTEADVLGFVQIDYAYNHYGNRVQQSSGGTTTNYLWDEFSRFGDVILETGVNPDTTLYHTMDYVLAGRMLVSQTDESNLTQYFLSDNQGSTRILANSDGSVAAEFSYDAFGNVNETIDPAAPDTTYLYTGQQFDPLTELYSLRARYYDPLSGRFLSRDTWAYNYRNPFELNRYAYAGNNPVRYSDPSGYSVSYSSISAFNIQRAGTIAGGYAGFASSTFFYMASWFGACGDDLKQWARNTNGTIYVASSTLYGIYAGYKMATLAIVNPTLATTLTAAGILASLPSFFGEGGGCYVGALMAGKFGHNKAMGNSSQPALDPGQNTSQSPLPSSTNNIVTPINSLALNNNSGFNSMVVPAIIGGTTTILADGGLLDPPDWLSPCNSFSADTTVETPDGDIPISEIEDGDTVIAYDEETGETGEYTVTDTISHEDEQIAYVTINGEEIETTPWHLFYTSEGWAEAEDLQEGDSIVSLGGVYGTVESVVIVDATQTMFDLTVEEVHTFAVGDGDWVVHNCNVDNVIHETQNATGDITSQYALTQDEAIELGIQWIGENDTIISADRGVYRSSTPNTDGTFNQFRIDPSSVAGEHKPNVPHIHLEVIEITPRGESSVVNNHIPIVP